MIWADQPFANPTLLPLQSISAIATPSALIVAPHPDDETLGCGGAIALLSASGCEVRVLVISDGTASHPNSVEYPPPRLRAVRAAETLEALAILGVDRSQVTFLNLLDGAIPTADAAEFPGAIDRCRILLQTFQPATIFLPWRFDPHLDHRATWQLIQTARMQVEWFERNDDNAPRLIEYPIWDWDVEQRGDLPTNQQEDSQIVGWRLEIQAVLEKKQKAIAAYQSQVSDLICDDPTGFRLTPDMLHNFAQPWELYLEEVK